MNVNGTKKQTLSFCGSSAFFLLPDLIQDAGQAGDRSQEGTQNGCNQSILAGQLTEAIELVSGQDRALHDAALDGQGVLVLLGKLADDTSRGDGVAGGGSHSGSTVQNLTKIVASVFGRKIFLFFGGENYAQRKGS